MSTRTTPPRWSPGFTLDEAARIRRMIATHQGAMTCPHCDAELKPTAGQDGEQRVWMVRCDACGLSVVVQGNG